MRVVNRVLAAVLGLALLASGLVVAVEIVVAGFDHEPWVVPHDRWYRSARLRAWDAAPPRWIFIGIVATGVVLLLVQVTGRRPKTFALTPGAVPADLARRSLEKALVREATSVDGVAAAKAKVDDATAEVVASSNRRQTDGLEPRITQALDRRIGSLGLARPPAVRVRVHGRSDR